MVRWREMMSKVKDLFLLCANIMEVLFYISPLTGLSPFEGRDLSVGLTRFMRKGEFYN